MDTTQGRMRLLLWIVIIVALVGGFPLLWVRGGASPASPAANNNGTPASGASGNAMTTTVTSAPAPASGATAPSPSKGGSTGPSASLPPKAITINLITPISGNSWTIGQDNSVAWSKAAGITGQIDLVNPQTKALVGVILSETGPNQTSYSWDARYIYAARYSAEKHGVVPGTYAIKIHFDGNGFGDLVSGPITIQN